MSLPFRLFPSGSPPVDSDRFLITRADAGSPTGFSNYLLTWAELKATITAGGVGSAGVPGLDGADGEDGMVIPGPAGATGPAGANGASGVVLFLVESEQEEPQLVPGPQGAQGPAGGGGSGGGITATSVNVTTPTLEAAFTVTDASVIPSHKINVSWGNCTQADENHPGMGEVAFNAVAGTGNFLLELFSTDQSFLFGTYKINYSIAN
jgi:hypothetical protein